MYPCTQVIARGFSPPTVSEVLREKCLEQTCSRKMEWIMKPALKVQYLNNKLYFDISGFLFDLKNTIVQRIDTNGVYYYVNAGSTKQNGIETYASYQVS